MDGWMDVADNGRNRRSNSGGKNWTATHRERGGDQREGRKRKSVRLFSTFCQPKYSLDHTSPPSISAFAQRLEIRATLLYLVGHFCADLGQGEKRGRVDPILEALHLREKLRFPFSHGPLHWTPGINGDSGEAIISFSGAKLSSNNLAAMAEFPFPLSYTREALISSSEWMSPIKSQH